MAITYTVSVPNFSYNIQYICTAGSEMLNHTHSTNVHNPTSVDLHPLLSGPKDLVWRNTAQGEVVAMDQAEC